MNISDLICEVINQYQNFFQGGATKTKILKLVYLVEIQYKRRSGDRLTNASWVYYLYGPYLKNYDALLQNENIQIMDLPVSDEKEAQILSLKNSYDNKNIPRDIRFLIGSIVQKYGEFDLRNLLDHVYFETEPMINVETRGEVLDFDTVMPEEYYKVKKLEIDPKTKRELRQDFRKRVEAIRGKRNA